MTIARVFPRRAKATPDDALAFVGEPGLFVPPVDAVHVSVSFTWDLPEAERLAKSWSRIAPVTVGGPATGQRGEAFIPGMYVKSGYVITSRGCPNNCWFCSVPKRDGQVVRELQIVDGCNVLDDNLLACSPKHIIDVFRMLSRQKERAQFTGGLEAKRLKDWHVRLLAELRPKQMFFAYDTPDDLEPLEQAGRMLLEAGFTTASHSLRCYVLCGWPKDTFDAAEQRMKQTIAAGFMPMAMLWRDKRGLKDPEWRTFQRAWARPAMIAARERGAA
jgi:hypothetical protein